MNDRTVLRATTSADLILGEILRGQAHPRGFLGLMEDGETSAGRTLVPVGAVKPVALPAADFKDAVVSVGLGEARIVLLTARRPGSGALRRLVAAIKTAGFTPVICEPVGDVMPAIMKRWGWCETVAGHGFERVSEWRPATGERREASCDPATGRAFGEREANHG